MKLQLYNLVGTSLKQEPGLPIIAEHANVQTFENVPSCWFDNQMGTFPAKRLREMADAGDLDYQFVLDAWDAGRIGVKRLKLTYARGHFTAADVSQVFEDDVALPAGAMLLQAHLDVHTVVDDATATITAASVKCGHEDDDDAFDAAEDVLAGATRRQLTTGAVGLDIGSKKLSMTLTADGNISTLSQGSLELVVTYVVVPTL